MTKRILRLLLVVLVFLDVGMMSSGVVRAEGEQMISLSLRRYGHLEVTDSLQLLQCTVSYCYLNAPEGTEITLTATVAPGWVFSGWSGELCSGNGACTFNLVPDTNSPGWWMMNQATISAVSQPESAGAGVTLSEVNLPPEVQGGKIKVYDISTDGRYLMYTHDGATSSSVVHWHDRQTSEDVVIGVDDYYAPAMSDNGKYIVFTHMNSVRLWDSDSRMVNQLAAEGTRAVISADGKFVAWWWSSSVVVLNRDTGNTVSFQSSWLPVMAPDGSTVAIPGSSGVDFYDPLTGEFQRNLWTPYTFTIQRISSNSAYAYGLVNNAPSSEIGVTRLDLNTGEVRRILRSYDPFGCSGYRFAITAPDGGSPFFTTWGLGDGSERGPLPDDWFDFYGMYQANFSEEPYVAVSVTGATTPLANPSNSCASVVGTPDGSTIVFATEQELPATTSNSGEGGGGATPSSVRATATRVGATATSANTGTRLVVRQISNVTDFRLTVQRTGTGEGTVVSSPTGVNCGNSCSASFSNGSIVNLTASPAEGSTFTGWSGACEGATACSVTMSEAQGVVAHFTLKTYPLLVSLGGAGSGAVSLNSVPLSCRPTCESAVRQGSKVTLVATPAIGSTFTGWSGACSGRGPCIVSMTRLRSVRALFAVATYSLSVSKTGTGSGFVSSAPVGLTCGYACRKIFPHGTEVTLTASPSRGSMFVGWSGACTGTSTCKVSMTQARNVTARFTKR